MKKTTFTRFPMDNSAILYLSLIRKDHTNTYRFTMELTDTVCPITLQKAVDGIYRRFPTVIAGFHPTFWNFWQVPAEKPPQVQIDPGHLTAMSREEIRSCAFRIFYNGANVIMEAFHALTDGYGAVICFTTLVAEYLRLRYEMDIPHSSPLMNPLDDPHPHELTDAYLEYAKGKPLQLPSRYAYQLPGGHGNRNAVFTETITLPVQTLLDASRARGVSVTALLSAAMAASIMDVQINSNPSRLKPVRIMVPVDLRRLFPSKTLRNFILYVLPTMEPHEKNPSVSVLHSFARQIQEQMSQDRLASILAHHVKTQRAWYFRSIPLTVKCILMRLAYRYFGESNSSITLTNVGNVRLPEQMQPYVKNLDVTLMPRVGSPYNCGFISCNGQLSIRISRFAENSELEEIFRKKLESLLEGEAL